MKKRQTSVEALLLPFSSVQRRFWLGLKVVAGISALICIFSLLEISRSNTYVDSLVFTPSTLTPKIAFLFLARTNLPLDFLWHYFFQNGDEEKFSIYVHSTPGFVFNESTTHSPYFYHRQLKQSVQIVWGDASMIQAERLLLWTALEDSSNQHFVLLSDSCIPLHNFTFTYTYVMSSSKSFIDSFIDPKDKRYNAKMSPVISKTKWRKGSQWVTLIRKHAIAVISDDVVFQVFQNHCKIIPPVYLGENESDQSFSEKQHDCISDEHYLQTLFSIYEWEAELERRSLTYTCWNHSSNKMNNQGWHPLTFDFVDASPQHIKAIKDTKHVYHDTGTALCQSNYSFVPCFLFARKFSEGAAMRLLNDGSIGPFDGTKYFLSLKCLVKHRDSVRNEEADRMNIFSHISQRYASLVLG